MNAKAKRSLFLIFALVAVYVMQQLGWLSGVINYIGALPFWVVLVMVGILVSFWQYLKHANDDEEEDEQWIEQEGAIYIRRMEAERERRGKKTGTV